MGEQRAQARASSIIIERISPASAKVHKSNNRLAWRMERNPYGFTKSHLQKVPPGTYEFETFIDVLAKKPNTYGSKSTPRTLSFLQESCAPPPASYNPKFWSQSSRTFVLPQAPRTLELDYKKCGVAPNLYDSGKYYSIGCEKRDKSNSAFLSKIPRIDPSFLDLKDYPEPGHYRIPPERKANVIRSPFLSKTARFGRRKQTAPGPGAYNNYTMPKPKYLLNLIKNPLFYVASMPEPR